MKIKPYIFEMAIEKGNASAISIAAKLREVFPRSEDDFIKEKTFSKLMKDLGLTFIGASNREVYGNGELVVKHAFTNYGVRQNRKEVYLKEDCVNDEYFTKLYEFDEHFRWIIAERVSDGLSDKELHERLLDLIEGCSDDFVRSMYALPPNEAIEYFQETIQFPGEVEFNLWVKGLSDEVIGCELITSDFGSANWGVRKNGDLVILDYGF
jgi:hypothetical protein